MPVYTPTCGSSIATMINELTNALQSIVATLEFLAIFFYKNILQNFIFENFEKFLIFIQFCQFFLLNFFFFISVFTCLTQINLTLLCVEHITTINNKIIKLIDHIELSMVEYSYMRYYSCAAQD